MQQVLRGFAIGDIPILEVPTTFPLRILLTNSQTSYEHFPMFKYVSKAASISQTSKHLHRRFAITQSAYSFVNEEFKIRAYKVAYWSEITIHGNVVRIITILNFSHSKKQVYQMEFFLAYVEVGKDSRAIIPTKCSLSVQRQISLFACGQLYII